MYGCEETGQLSAELTFSPQHDANDTHTNKRTSFALKARE